MSVSSKYQKIYKTLGKNRIKSNEPMGRHTTFGIGGPADWYYEAKTQGDLVRAVKLVHEIGIPFLILGGGSNLLVSDEGFRGLAIKASNSAFKIQKTNSRHKLVAGSGMMLSELLELMTGKGLTGLEFLTGIPGTVGGAVWGNAGAWQQNISDYISSVKVIGPDLKPKNLKKEECRFSYRSSCFQESGEVILAANFLLRKGDRKQIESRIDDYRSRKMNQPKKPSAGCIFRNPKPKAAGFLIDQCGLKGKKIGQAQISPKHANFIVNLGGARAFEVIQLIKLAKKAVLDRFGIELKEEISLVG